MKQGLTEIIAVLDMTGSMHSQTDDTIGGFNGFIEEQRKIPGACNVTVVFFNSEEYKKWLEATPLAEVPPLTKDIYRARMNTPLYDVIGKTINSVGMRLNGTVPSEIPEKVLILIMTDGKENWSKEFSLQRVIEMIRHQREKYNWEFVFLGADLDSFGQGEQLGIRHAVNYEGRTREGYKAIHRAVSAYRVSGKITDKDLKS